MRRFLMLFALCALFLAACGEEAKEESGAKEKARKLTDELIEDLEAKEDSIKKLDEDSLR